MPASLPPPAQSQQGLWPDLFRREATEQPEIGRQWQPPLPLRLQLRAAPGSSGD
jgi:hypothetical protein